ncbi:MAG: dihydroorotase [Gudongella sp.]|nr:dihydroorotase [Gudongella sp.]
MKLLIKGAHLIDGHHAFNKDIYMENGKIEEIGEDLDCDCQWIDAKGLVLLPAFVDIHAHFRDPGQLDKEDLVTGGMAALKGGYTFVNLMGNTDPVCSNMETINYVRDKARDLDLVEVHQCASITENFDGGSLEHLDRLDKDVRMITDDGKGVASTLSMYRAMEKARDRGIIVMAHAEEMDLTQIDYRLSENLETVRDIYLAKHTGARLHLTHVSTREAIEEIRRGKADGADNITCDVTPHHISMWDKEYRVNPPIRGKEDVEALIEGIKDGTVDAIGTDHAPHTPEDKEKGSPGISGIETSFQICHTHLVKAGHIQMGQLVRLMSENPARILGLNKGRLEKGYDGDVVLVDLDKESQVHPDRFVSKGKNTPFSGLKVQGEIILTIRGGSIKYMSKECGEERLYDNR